MSLRVLVVDDDIQFLSLTARKLEEEGMQVLRAQSCSDVRNVLGSEDVDCIVTEYGLPGKPGKVLCDDLKSLSGDVPLILFTSGRDSEMVRNAFGNGVDDYVSKDSSFFKFSVLVERIRKAAEESPHNIGTKVDSSSGVEEVDVLKKVVDLLPAGVVVRDGEDRVVMANKRAAGDDTELGDVIGSRIEDSPLTGEQIKRIKETDEAAIENWDAVTVEQNFDIPGEGERYLETTKIPFNLDEGENPHLVSVLADISSRKKKERALEKVIETNRKMSEMDTKEEVKQVAVEAMCDIFDLPMCAAFEIRGREFVPEVSNFELEEVFEGTPSLSIDSSIAGEVYSDKESRIIEEVNELDPQNPDTRIASEVIVPVGGHGVLIAGSEEQKEFDQVDMYIADWFGDSVKSSLDRVEREKEILERDEKLERQEQQMDQFVRMLSHDLRNPLNIAQGYLEMLENSDEKDQVGSALNRMDEIIETVLEMAKHTKKLEKQQVDLRKLSNESWSYDYMDNAELEVVDEVTVEANKEQLKHLLENIFSNSIKHSDQSVTVRVGSTSKGFYVEDDGPGIPESERNKVFEFGYTTQDSTGIGLTIVEKIANFQGWKVKVSESTKGGARFEFET
ncbi:hybrid sensor histidine kinase/response regulator [Candidatus Nanohalobium constans]|uniref:histidine kinase n=1 Tax=Candidatus Nanohalobium constans TaxID=2565781 RepID=A0A5Q0UIS7_9ARCH|nr:ATP-binding protein [Candidatus Nanohalobium constans]QGA80855.1 PAS domain S-box protein [Candidatus Nanohalobium constans]